MIHASFKGNLGVDPTQNQTPLSFVATRQEDSVMEGESQHKLRPVVAKAKRLRSQIVEFLRANGEHGATTAEIAEYLGLRTIYKVQPQVQNLKKIGAIVNSGETRAGKGFSKPPAIVWRVPK